MTTTTSKNMHLPAGDRGRAHHDWLQSYHTFSFGDYYDPRYMHFGALRVINEDTVAPGAGFPTHPHRDMEIITYVLEGELEHKDSLGTGSIIRPGEIQKMSAGTGILHSEFNASQEKPVHLLQIWIIPNSKGDAPSYEQETMDLTRAENAWLPIATPQGGNGAVSVKQDMQLLVTRLEAGRELPFEIVEGRQAWVQVARGTVEVDGLALTQGDGYGIRNAGALTFKGLENAEILLFDLAKSSAA